jgi:hypothetical protein
MRAAGSRGISRKTPRTRETYVPPDCLLPEVRMVGWDHFRKAEVMGLAQFAARFASRLPDPFRLFSGRAAR